MRGRNKENDDHEEFRACSVTFPLRCTVRGCHRPLMPCDRTLRCAAGHSFDRARQGYWSLIQPTDRKSKTPGDPDAAVDARGRWLASGRMDPLVNAVGVWIGPDRGNRRTMDLGCGEGHFAASLFGQSGGRYCGVDLSKRALRVAARRLPEATWVHANADRTLPAAGGAVDLVLSLFGRRPVAEIARVLAPTGRVLVAVPGAEDLIELRRRIMSVDSDRDRTAKVIESFAARGLRCEHRGTWSDRVWLGAADAADAMTMTYRGGRPSQSGHGLADFAGEVTLQAELMLFAKQFC